MVNRKGNSMKPKFKKIITLAASATMMLTTLTPYMSLFAHAETTVPVSEQETTIISDETVPGESSSLPIELVTIDSSEVLPGIEGNVTEPVTEEETIPELPAAPSETKPEKTEKKDKYKIILSLYSADTNTTFKSKEVTLTIKVNGKKQKIEFTKENNYFVTTELPVGEYEILKVKTNSRYIKMNLNASKIIVGEQDYQSMSLEAVEKEWPFLLKLLASNWFYIVAIIGLFIALDRYNKKKAG